MNIYVVGTRTEGTGGFEWRYTRHDAEREADESVRMAYMCHTRGERFEVTGVREVELPDFLAEKCEQIAEEITRWLDSDPELWEPNGEDFPTVTIRGTPPRRTAP